jgi:hypothetical protein
MDNAYRFKYGNKTYTIITGVGKTKLLADSDDIYGLPLEYNLKYFMCNERDKNITVSFSREVLSPVNGKVIKEDTITWTLSDEDYMYFEMGIGVPIIKPSLINGLLVTKMMPKFFGDAGNILWHEQEVSEDGPTSTKEYYSPTLPAKEESSEESV